MALCSSVVGSDLDLLEALPPPSYQTMKEMIHPSIRAVHTVRIRIADPTMRVVLVLRLLCLPMAAFSVAAPFVTVNTALGDVHGLTSPPGDLKTSLRANIKCN